MLQNGHNFEKSWRIKIYFQMQDHLLKVFENLSDHFGILGIKELSIFIKNFSRNLLFFTTSSFKFTSVSVYLYIYIYIYVQLFFNC